MHNALLLLLLFSAAVHSRRIALKLSRDASLYYPNTLRSIAWLLPQSAGNRLKHGNRALIARDIGQTFQSMLDNCKPLEIGDADDAHYYICDVAVTDDNNDGNDAIVDVIRQSPDVEWAEEQRPLKRTKRSFKLPDTITELNDPLVNQQWYLVITC